MQVVKINPNGLNQIMKRNSVTLFYADWCGFCQKLKPHYQEFAEQLHKINPTIKVTAIDMDKYGDEIKGSQTGLERYGRSIGDDIKGYPTIMFFDKSKGRMVYSGNRDASSLMKAAKEIFLNTE